VKTKLILSQYLGAIFFVKEFDIFRNLLFNKQDLAVFRVQTSVSFYYPVLENIATTCILFPHPAC